MSDSESNKHPKYTGGDWRRFTSKIRPDLYAKKSKARRVAMSTGLGPLLARWLTASSPIGARGARPLADGLETPIGSIQFTAMPVIS